MILVNKRFISEEDISKHTKLWRARGIYSWTKENQML